MKRWLAKFAWFDVEFKTKAECTYGLVLSLFGVIFGIGGILSGTSYTGGRAGSLPKTGIVFPLVILLCSTVLAGYFFVKRRQAN